MEAGSLQRSMTTTFFTVAGRAARKRSVAKGRKRWTLTRPYFSPWAFLKSTISSTASQTEPMATMTVSASGWP